MAEIEICKKCKVPVMVSQGHVWENNGVISLAISPANRMVFYESDNIDVLFAGIEELLGFSIEHIVIESRRRETLKYMLKNFPEAVKEVSEYRGEKTSREYPDTESLVPVAKEIMQSIQDIGRVYGYGVFILSDLWEEGADYPWRTTIYSNPYSMLFSTGDNLGSVEAFEGIDMTFEYKETGKDTYRIAAYPGQHPIEFKERLKRKRYELKPGDISYDRCPGCGVPLEVTRYHWDSEEGTITDPDTGRRMAIFAPGGMEAILDDLEAELGEAIPETVIEAQRRYIKSAWGTENWRQDAPTFQHLMAMRGLGNLVKFDGNSHSLSITIENPCLPLLMVGTTQALMELVLGFDSSVYEWSRSEDGDLEVDVSAA